MNRLTQDRSVEEPGAVDVGDLAVQTLHQAEEPLQPRFRELLCTHNRGCFDPMRSMRPALWTMRVGFQCRS